MLIFRLTDSLLVEWLKMIGKKDIHDLNPLPEEQLEQPTPKPFFEGFPDETIVHILSFLNKPTDLLRIGLTEKNLYGISKYSSLWKKHLQHIRYALIEPSNIPSGNTKELFFTQIQKLYDSEVLLTKIEDARNIPIIRIDFSLEKFPPRIFLDAITGNSDAIKQYIQKQMASLQMTLQGRNHLLAIAVAHGHSNMLKMFEDQDAIITMTIQAQAFMISANFGNLPMMQTLWCEIDNIFINMSESSNQFLSPLAAAFVNAAHKGHLPILQWLLETARKSLSTENKTWGFIEESLNRSLVNRHWKVFDWLQALLTAPDVLLREDPIDKKYPYSNYQILKSRILPCGNSDSFKRYIDAISPDLNNPNYITDLIDTFCLVTKNGTERMFDIIYNNLLRELALSPKKNSYIEKAFIAASKKGMFERMSFFLNLLSPQEKNILVIKTMKILARKKETLDSMKWLVHDFKLDPKVVEEVFNIASMKGNIVCMEWLILKYPLSSKQLLDAFYSAARAGCATSMEWLAKKTPITNKQILEAFDEACKEQTLQKCIHWISQEGTLSRNHWLRAMKYFAKINDFTCFTFAASQCPKPPLKTILRYCLITCVISDERLPMLKFLTQKYDLSKFIYDIFLNQADRAMSCSFNVLFDRTSNETKWLFRPEIDTNLQCMQHLASTYPQIITFNAQYNVLIKNYYHNNDINNGFFDWLWGNLSKASCLEYLTLINELFKDAISKRHLRMIERILSQVPLAVTSAEVYNAVLNAVYNNDIELLDRLYCPAHDKSSIHNNLRILLLIAVDRDNLKAVNWILEKCGKFMSNLDKRIAMRQTDKPNNAEILKMIAQSLSVAQPTLQPQGFMPLYSVPSEPVDMQRHKSSTGRRTLSNKTGKKW